MKKVVSLFLCIILFAVTFAPAASALEEKEIQYFEDGSYIIVEFDSDGTEGIFPETMAPEGESSMSFFERIISILKKIIAYLFGERSEEKTQEEPKEETRSVSKTKYARYYDADGILLWSVYLTAGFSYDGKKAECVSASVSYQTFDSDWKMLSSASAKDGATATGAFSVRQYKLGVPLKTVEKTLTLTCDEKGNVK